jgi:hypothetical protein
MSWILEEYRNLFESAYDGKITREEFEREKEKLKERYGVKGFCLDGVAVKNPIKINEILENLKEDVLKICPSAKIEVDSGEWVLVTSSGEILLSRSEAPSYVTIKIGKYSIFVARNGFSEESMQPLDETCSKILDLIAEKYYGLKRPR